MQLEAIRIDKGQHTHPSAGVVSSIIDGLAQTNCSYQENDDTTIKQLVSQPGQLTAIKLIVFGPAISHIFL